MTFPLAKPGRPSVKPKRKLVGLSPRVRKALDLLVFGDDNGTRPDNYREAAKTVGFSPVTLREALRNPIVVAHYKSLVAQLRDGELVKSLLKVVHLRDNADSEQVQLRAARFLYGEDQGGRGGVNVTVGVAVTPGYVIDLRPVDQEERAKELASRGLLGLSSAPTIEGEVVER